MVSLPFWVWAHEDRARGSPAWASSTALRASLELRRDAAGVTINRELRGNGRVNDRDDQQGTDDDYAMSAGLRDVNEWEAGLEYVD